MNELLASFVQNIPADGYRLKVLKPLHLEDPEATGAIAGEFIEDWHRELRSFIPILELWHAASGNEKTYLSAVADSASTQMSRQGRQRVVTGAW